MSILVEGVEHDGIFTCNGKTVRLVPGQVWELRDPGGTKRRMRITDIRGAGKLSSFYYYRVYGRRIKDGRTCSASIRRFYGENAVLIEDVADREPPRLPKSEPAIERRRTERIHTPRGIRRLNPKFAEALALRRQGVSHADIAKRLGTTPKMVANWLTKARENEQDRRALETLETLV